MEIELCRDSQKPAERALIMKRRQNIFLVISLLLTFLWEAPAHGLDRVRVGLSALSPTNWAVWVAEEQGLFKKHGIDPQVIFIGGGFAQGRQCPSGQRSPVYDHRWSRVDRRCAARRRRGYDRVQCQHQYSTIDLEARDQ